VKVSVFVADFAQVDDRGKLSAIGMAWSTVGSPLPPHGIAIILEVDWHEANERRSFVLELLDEDGEPVSFDESGEPALRLEGGFEVGRPPGLAKGTPLFQAFAVNIPGGLPLPAGHRYEYRVSVGEVTSAAGFAVIQVV
jgi:hypothetical protein